MKKYLELLRHPYSLDANLIISDAMINEALKLYVKAPALKAISCQIHEGFFEINIEIKLLMLSKIYALEVEIEDFVFEPSRHQIVLLVRQKSVAIIGTVLNAFGINRLKSVEFRNNRFYINLALYCEKVEAPILRKELEKLKISKPLLTPHNVHLKLFKI